MNVEPRRGVEGLALAAADVPDAQPAAALRVAGRADRCGLVVIASTGREEPAGRNREPERSRTFEKSPSREHRVEDVLPQAVVPRRAHAVLRFRREALPGGFSHCELAKSSEKRRGRYVAL